MRHIGFNLPYITGKEVHHIYDAIFNKHLSGNGKYTKLCHHFFVERYGFHRVLLTTSCTDALEMCALLIDTQPGDEIIMPSYTFVSTANAFVLRGARIVFADSYSDHPNMNPDEIEALITPRTKAIVVMHYGGVANDMKKIQSLVQKYHLHLIEDAAQAIDSYYIAEEGQRRPLGGIGHLGTMSFHETKNIISGEGGLLIINHPQFEKRAEILWERGTNRAAFFRGEVDKYSWVDVGSSFLPSEITAAFLYAQLENLDHIQQRRKQIWQTYYENLRYLEASRGILLPIVPSYSTNNYHLFYIVCRSLEERTALIQHLRNRGIHAVFHYQSLHKSPFYQDKHDGRELINSDKFSDCLLRLPLYCTLSEEEQGFVIESIWDFYG
jgi:dTDP-4-amino-4,6-dideoxygalactose transaminase